MLASLQIVVGLVAAGLPKAIPKDFTAKLTVVRSGLTYSGTMQYDGTGRRWMEHLEGLEQTSISVQPDGRTVAYNYVVIPTKPDPTCTCRTEIEADLSDPWFVYMNGVANGTCTGKSSGKSGTLYTVDMSSYVNSPPVYELCQAADGTPIYTTKSQEFREYTTFTPGRAAAFNMTALQAFLPTCSAGCSAPPS